MRMTFSEQREPWRRGRWVLIFAVLTIAVLCVHGYHPLAEDGGLYLAGVEYSLDHTLFPRYTEFVREHLRFSLFAPVVVVLVRVTRLSMPAIVFLMELGSIALTLAGARAVARRVFAEDVAQLAGVMVMAAWWTLPVAGTSLMLMDPYVTARSFSTPLSLFVVAFALDGVRSRRSMIWGGVCFLLAAAMHPLMAGLTLCFVPVLWSQEEDIERSRRWKAAALLLGVALAAAGVVQSMGAPESEAMKAAVVTRYYWFLSQWQWYELLGVIAPLVIFVAMLHWDRLHAAGKSLCRACVLAGVIACYVALCFAREDLATHLVARFQVLRLFLLLYALMGVLLGGVFAQAMAARRSVMVRVLPFATIALLAAIMGWVQRQTFPLSQVVEVPWRADSSTNPWVQAFLWARNNTLHDAVFALDAKYVNRDGEDAQTFRAWSMRSAVPDYSKDGGEAAITPTLADVWIRGAAAQKDLSQQDDVTRDARLKEEGATWMVLLASAKTIHDCPYRNDTVKVCRLVSGGGSGR